MFHNIHQDLKLIFMLQKFSFFKTVTIDCVGQEKQKHWQVVYRSKLFTFFSSFLFIVQFELNTNQKFAEIRLFITGSMSKHKPARTQARAHARATHDSRATRPVRRTALGCLNEVLYVLILPKLRALHMTGF